MRFRSELLIVLHATVLAIAIPAHAQMDEAPLHALLAAVVARNAIAHPVAASKYPQSRAVEDPPREAQVIAGKRAYAQQHGLDADAVEQLYRQLIAASKLVQYMDFQHFGSGQVVPPAPALEVLRARIDAADARVLKVWPQLQALREAPPCSARLAAAIAAQPNAVAAVERVALVRAMVGFCHHHRSAQSQR